MDINTQWMGPNSNHGGYIMKAAGLLFLCPILFLTTDSFAQQFLSMPASNQAGDCVNTTCFFNNLLGAIKTCKGNATCAAINTSLTCEDNSQCVTIGTTGFANCVAPNNLQHCKAIRFNFNNCSFNPNNVNQLICPTNAGNVIMTLPTV
jgi:hypothetical protein